MTREHKHIVIYGAFGLLLGAKIVEVLISRSDASALDWWLLLVGIGAAIVHYLPVREIRTSEKEDKDADDTLVLRNHTHIKREQTPRRDPEPAGGRDEPRSV